MTNDPFSPPHGVHPLKFRILLCKRYFETGLSILNYAKYVAGGYTAKAALDNDNVLAVVIAGGYACLCFFVGWFWHRYRLVTLEIEIGNRFNDFVNEMREFVEK